MIKLQLCEYCKKEFDFDTRHGVGKYCSIVCANRAKNKVAEHHSMILQLFSEGNTYEEIARYIGHSGKRVKNYLVRNNLPLRTRGEAMKLTRQKHPSAFQLKPMRGKDNPHWKGGRVISSSGYIFTVYPEHCRADSKGYVFEHILVWERVHNKPLPKGWVIHHLNGIKSDNRPENLVAMSRSRHANYIPILKRKIRELEAEVELLEKTLDASQMIFKIGDN